MYNPSTDNCWYRNGNEDGGDIMKTNCYFNHGYHNGLNGNDTINTRSVEGSMPNKICGNRCKPVKEWWSGCGEKAHCHYFIEVQQVFMCSIIYILEFDAVYIAAIIPKLL